MEVLARVRSEQLRVVDAAAADGRELSAGEAVVEAVPRGRASGSDARQRGAGIEPGAEPKFRRQVLQLVRKKYGGEVGERFGPTLAAEHLAAEDGMKVMETLRRWMLAEGLWSRERQRRAHRQRRERKEHFGELVQMDGSFHAWLEERGPEGCLMNMVDDATSTTLGAAGGGRDDLGGGGGAAGVDRALRGAAGAVRGLEECVRAGATPGSGCGERSR